MGASGAGSLQAAHLRSEFLAVSAIRSTHFLRAFRRLLTLSATCHASVHVVRVPLAYDCRPFSRRIEKRLVPIPNASLSVARALPRIFHPHADRDVGLRDRIDSCQITQHGGCGFKRIRYFFTPRAVLRL